MTPHIAPSQVLPGGVLPLRSERTVREPFVELGWPGLEAKEPCLDVFIFDSSGSVIAPRGKDPVGNQFEEAKKAIGLVGQWSFTDRSKVAVVHFDHPVGASAVVALNDRQLMRKLSSSLDNPGGRGISDLLPPLLELERLAVSYPDHHVRGTIFSDFALTDARPEEVFSRLGTFPGQIHAVVLGGVVPPDLIQDSITVTPLTAQDAPGTFSAAVLRSLTATRRAARSSALHTPHGGKQVLS